MYSATIILTLISIAYAGTIEPSYLKGMERFKRVPEAQLTVNNVNNNSFSNIYNNPSPVYTTANLPRTENFTPTYSPTNSPANSTTNSSANSTTAVQETSRWSFQNIVSSLLPFATHLYLYGSRVSSFMWRFIMVILVGIVSTGLICMHTPLCNMSFPGKNQVSRNIFIHRN